MANEEYGKIPREEIGWFPTIDVSRCTECGVCADFCHQRVFAFDEDAGEMRVDRPYSCIVGCTGCVDQCPEGAISFPTLIELREMLRDLRTKHNG